MPQLHIRCIAATSAYSLALATLFCRADELVIHAHTAGVSAVAFSCDGNQIATAGNRPQLTVLGIESRAKYGEVKIWDASTGKNIRELTGTKEPMRCVAYSPDAQLLAASSGGTSEANDKKDYEVYVWATNGFKLQHKISIPGSCNSIGFSRDSKSLLAGLGQTHNAEFAIEYDIASGNRKLVLQAPNNQQVQYGADVRFSPDGKSVAAIRMFAGGSNIIEIWDAKPPKLQQTIAQGRELRCIAYSPDGKILAIGQVKGKIALHDATTGKLLRTLGANEFGFDINRLVFSPDGQMLACAELEDIRIWNVSNANPGEKPKKALQAHKAWITGLSFSPDGKRLASASLDETVHVWDIAKMQK